MAASDDEFVCEPVGPVLSKAKLAALTPSPTNTVTAPAPQKAEQTANIALEKRMCKICKQELRLCMFPRNASRYNTTCSECKRSLDCLRRQAKAQNEEGWWKTVLKQEGELQVLVLKYRSDNPSRGERVSRGHFRIVTYKESRRSGQRLTFRKQGQMMTFERWVEYAQAAEGGKYSVAEANQEWEQMKKTGVKSDYKGRNNSLRLFVHMVDWVLADDYEEVEKELSLSTKPKDFRTNRDHLEKSLGELEEEFAYDADAGPSYAAPRLGVQGVRAAANTFTEELAKSLQTPSMKRPLQALQQEAYELSVRGRKPQPAAGGAEAADGEQERAPDSEAGPGPTGKQRRMAWDKARAPSCGAPI